MIDLICVICGNKFKRYPFVIKTGRGKCCSVKCAHKYLKIIIKGGHPNSLKNLKRITSERAKELGFGKWMKGKILSESTRKKISESLKGGNRASWKKGQHISEKTEFKKVGVVFEGTQSEYKKLHLWVYKNLGKPTLCNNCIKNTIINTTNIQWANKSHEYKKELDDWIQLCPKCHFKYDKKFENK